MRRRMTAFVLSLTLCLGLLTTGASAAGFTRGKTYTPGQFTDVPDSAWYATSVKDCYELGLMSGSSATTFNPTGMFTVAEAATIAARMHNLYTGGNGVLPASAGAWYQSAVDYCVNNGVFAAGDFNSYTRSATRAEMAQIMAAALPDSAWTARNQVTQLPDVTAVTPGAEAIFKLYNAGVFTGSDEYGKFQPYANITRAEVAAIVARCADESQRKTLNLTPLSQLEAPVIPGGIQDSHKHYPTDGSGAYSDYTIDDNQNETYDYGDVMSNGRLRFKDPATGKFGYLDAAGSVVIPAIYDAAWDFRSGYAKVGVKDPKEGTLYGLINPSGEVTVPLIHHLLYWRDEGWGEAGKGTFIHVGAGRALIVDGKLVTDYQYNSGAPGTFDMRKLSDNAYAVYKEVEETWSASVVNAAGREIIPSVKGALANEFYIAALMGGRVDVYDQASGTLLYTVPGATGAGLKAGSRLIIIKEGNKYALFTGTGRITETVYDDIELVENSQLAYVKYGDNQGVAGLNGEIIPPSSYTHLAIINDGYISMMKDGASYIADSTGVLFPLNAARPSYAIAFADGYFWGGTRGIVFDATGQQLPDVNDHILGKHGVLEYKSKNEATGEKNYYYVVNGHTYGPYTETTCNAGPQATFYVFAVKNENGIWDYINTDGEHGTGYATKEEALGAGDEKFYSIVKNQAGKPYVGLGNKTIGYTPVIEFYKNNLNYDEIKYIGEGYYACRFNTTWYLRHI